LKNYSLDLAYVHDVGFGGFAKSAAPGLLAILRACGVTTGRVVDLACGSGIWARALAGAGYDAWGVDLSASMIAIARRKAPRARFERRSLFTFEFPRCHAVTCIGEGLNYLFDRRNVARERVRLFSRIHDALHPGSVFIFDVAELGRVGQVRGAGSRKAHWHGRDFCILTDVEEDPARELLTRKITTFRRVGRLYRRSFETHRLRLYRASALARELRETGFTVRFLRAYGVAPLLPGRVGFLARKRARP